MRIRPLEYKEAKFSARIVLAFMWRQFGKLLSPYRVIAYRPATLWSFTILSSVAAYSHAVDKSLKFLVSLRVAQIVGCPF
jgi:hypothetical protein